MNQAVKLILLVALFVLSLAAGAIAAEDGVPRMEPQELVSMIDSPDVVIIDVRRKGDWKMSTVKIKNARRAESSEVKQWAKDLSKDKTIVLYCACHDEYTSARVGRYLIGEGFTKVYALKGGWHRWEVEEFPVEDK